MKKIILSIEGMTCSSCSNGLEKYLNKQIGIYNASVNLVLATTVIEYDDKILTIEKLEEYIRKSGFKSLGEFKKIKLTKTRRGEKATFIIFTILALVLVYIKMGHMLNLPTISFLDNHPFSGYYCLTLLFLTLPFLIYGFDIIKNGYKNLIHKTPNMDTLVGIGVITSFLYSLYNMFLVFNGQISATVNMYFESSAIVIYFVKLGRFIDSVSKDKTKEALGALVSITPATATKKIGNEYKEVTLDEIKKNDVIMCKPGEKIAVDGEIIKGSSHFDESFLTGESKPISKGIGSKVLAGSTSFDGLIEYKAERIGAESTISAIVRLVIEASNSKAPISTFADKVSSIFVPFVIMLAIISLIFSLIITQDIGSSITTFVAVLVVACPCSLGLATPLAMIISEGLCAENGILIKKSAILEIACKVDTVIFDKTGTLTYGDLRISNFINYTNLSDEDILSTVSSIEFLSNHPIANAFKSHIKNKKVSLKEVKNYQELAGLGIKAEIEDDVYLLGNNKLLNKYKIKNTHIKDEKKLASNGESLMYVVKNNKIIALIGVNDVIRSNSKELINYLAKNNIETIMLTGDNKKTALKISSLLGIKNVISDCLPANKADAIRKLKEDKKITMMCGDGINDSVALSLSTIGVSIQSGADIANDSADVILTKSDLKSIINLINISKRTLTIVKENLFWAFFYNTLMIPIAMGIFKPWGISLSPMLASLAMVISSLTVILNSLRLKRVKTI